MPNPRRNNGLAASPQLSVRLLGAAELRRVHSDVGTSDLIALGPKQFALLANLARAKQRSASRAMFTELRAPDSAASGHLSPDQRDERAGNAIRDLIRQLRADQPSERHPTAIDRLFGHRDGTPCIDDRRSTLTKAAAAG